ncbi:hypothetical protein SAMN05445756_1269 [Kytococcus aerolatus]|uniref:Uncharacterized protein n=1 Tax=Kytococcus aerolatus TaxID=592308 RepID=A0A212TGK1_9MICO|nr:DLW-39 family protein [Kytococcus aerolatus]SNC65187.1 hypothetical protein SAMN05445756_1269 [Kytococcus aerolatus]
MKKLIIAATLAGAAALAARQISRRSVRTAELWAVATDDLPPQA